MCFLSSSGPLCSRHGILPCYAMAKQLHFNKDGSALKKMQAGVDKLASVVGITLGPKVRPPFLHQALNT